MSSLEGKLVENDRAEAILDVLTGKEIKEYLWLLIS